MAETTTLPADPEKTGNVWCGACQQSLPAHRAAAHLSSKKHQQSLEPRARATKPKADDADPDGPGPEAESKAPRVKRAAKKATPGGLIADPGKAGNYWCGICSVSLTPAKAEGHAATARHQENEKRTLTSAMRVLRVDGK